MDLQSKKYLDDILNAIILIEEFTAGLSTFDSYTSDRKTASAVERQLGIIGEAANKFTKQDRNNILENSVRIIGLRNRIIHAYDSVDDSLIWAIIIKYLPLLKSEVITKLEL